MWKPWGMNLSYMGFFPFSERKTLAFLRGIARWHPPGLERATRPRVWPHQLPYLFLDVLHRWFSSSSSFPFHFLPVSSAPLPHHRSLPRARPASPLRRSSPRQSSPASLPGARPQRRRELVRLDPGIPAAYETDVVARDDAVERGAGDTDKVAAVLSSSTPT
jgi:hypothetical protein